MHGWLAFIILLNTGITILGQNAVNQTAKNNATSSEYKNPLDLANNPALVAVLFASLCASVWLLYITFFNSRLFGIILTKIVNRFVIQDDAYFQVGSFSVSLLSGKFMFRDVKYITKDYSVRVVDGFAIFGWWLRFTPKEIGSYHGLEKHPSDDNHPMSRLVVNLNGLEAHLYNRSSLYDRLHEVFKNERYGDARKSTAGVDAEAVADSSCEQTSTEKSASQWMDLIPTIKCNVNSGKIALGNKLVETTFWIHCNNAEAIYHTSSAASAVDEFTHVVKGKCEDVRVMLSPSPGFTGKKSQPPRFMGEGFVILQSGEIDYTYFQDVPGIIPEDCQRAPEADPVWSLSLIFNKSTTITYGPWADKQREMLQKMFLPQDYQEIQAARPVLPGERRIHTGFDFKSKFQAPVAMDILFSKNDELSALHVSAGQGSTIHFFMPWAVNEFGYTSTLLIQLQKLDLTTSLDFRKLLECETMEAEVIMTVPRVWNQFQHWSCEFMLSETTMYFIYQHTLFVQDLLSDWASTTPGDVAFFMPYEWEFKFHFRNYELICIVNEHNWIDCNNDIENNQLAFCGEAIEISFLLPFTKFLPEVEEIKFFCRAESLVLRMFMADSNTLRHSVLSLIRSSDHYDSTNLSRINSIISDTDDQTDRPDTRGTQDARSSTNLDDLLCKGWRRKTEAELGWLDVCSAPVLVLNIFYKFHPIHVTNDNIDEINRRLGIDYSEKEVADLEPDLLTVELEAGPLAIKLLGSLFRQFIFGFKENYFGVSQQPTEFDAVRDSKNPIKDILPDMEATDQKDARHYRPMHAHVTVVLLDIKAELTKHCSPGEPPSPVMSVERLTFEMNKTYRETMMQLIISPATIAVKDRLKRSPENSHLSRGFLSLSGLQFRGDAFFSDKEIPRGCDTIEYAWQFELQCGEVGGKLTLLQLQSLAMWLEVFILHVTDEENALVATIQDVKCQHGYYQRQCKLFEMPSTKCKAEDAVKPSLCPTEADLKYKMSRFSIESVNLWLVESQCACNVKASPIRISKCSSHTSQLSSGGSFFVNDLTIKQFVQDLSPPEEVDRMDGSSRSQSFYPLSNNWLEVAVTTFGPITADSVTYANDVTIFNEQQQFLRKHDELLKRLWFLWTPKKLKSKIAADRSRSIICGCVGGCRFFGNNVNGVRFFTVQVLDAGEMHFSRYGSESIWGGVNDRQGIEERLRHRSGGLSLQSLGESSLRLRKISELANRRSGGKNFDSIGVWSSMSGSTRQSEYHRESMASRLPNDRSRSTDVGGSMGWRSRHRTESEGTFYSCESEIASIINGNDEEDAIRRHRVKKRGSDASFNSSIESFISAVASREDLVSLDVTDAAPTCSKPLILPALAGLYGQHLKRATCSNWKCVPPEELSRRCSLLTNLKAIYFPVRASTSSILPKFQQSTRGRLPFVIASKKTVNLQSSNGPSEAVDDDNVFRNTSLQFVHKSLSTGDLNLCHSSLNVKVHKGIQVVVAPVLLQCIERYTQSLRGQEKIQHPAYILDSLHLHSIRSSENRYGENHALEVLEMPNDTDTLPSKKVLLSNLFPKVRSSLSFDIPTVNFVALQVSAEPFCVSEQSSLSGQCGSKFSNDFAFPKYTCTVAMAASFSGLNISHAAEGEHKPLSDLAITLLRRSSTFRSSVDQKLLQELHEITESDSNVVRVSLQRADVQLQRLDCEEHSDDSSFVTAIPKSKTIVPFSVYKGDDVDVDDLSWLEQKFGEPMGKIMLEFGFRNIKMNMLRGERVSILSRSGQSNSLKNPRKSNAENDMSPDLQTTSGTEMPPKNQKFPGDVELQQTSDLNLDCVKAEPSILESESPTVSCSLLKGDDSPMGHSPMGHVILEIQNSDADSGISQVLRDETKRGKLLQSRSNEKQDSGSINDWNQKGDDAEEYVLKRKIQGIIEIENVWLNLAHPTRLKVLQEGSDHCINLITSVVPSICCWIPVYVELARAVDSTAKAFRSHRFSLLAYVMGQALPDKGRLLIKHNINSMATERARFLQEDHSSQLVFVLRRHLMGSKMRRVKSALEDKISMPKVDVLEKGIHALARQWKALIIGSTRTEMAFKSERRKHVVGRGVLTRKDLAILMRDRSSINEDLTSAKSTAKGASHDDVSPKNRSESRHSRRSGAIAQDQLASSSGLLNDSNYGNQNWKSHVASRQSSPGSARNLLRKSSSEESPGAALFSDEKEAKTELNLYDWLSSTNSPRVVSETANVRCSDSRQINEAKTENPAQGKPGLNMQDAGIFRMTSPMVSVPTSGMQLENVTEIFKCLFDAIGLVPPESENFLTEETLCGDAGLRKFEVNIVCSEDIANDSQDETPNKECRWTEKPTTALLVEKIRLVGDASTSSTAGRPKVYLSSRKINDPVPKDIKFDICFGSITQIVNIALIRLLLQITETIDVVKEENRFAQKTKSLELLESEGLATGATSKRNVKQHAVHKGWRTMYNVLQLYANESGLPKDRERVDERRKTNPCTPKESKDTRIEANETSFIAENSGEKKRKSTISESWISRSTLVGTGRLANLKLLAYIGGMNLETEVTNMNASCYKVSQHLQQKGNDTCVKLSETHSVSAHVDDVNLVLTESVTALNQKQKSTPRSPRLLRSFTTITTCKVNRSHFLLTSKPSSCVKAVKRVHVVVGEILVDVPQHPGVLRTVGARFTKRLEKHFIEIDNYRKLKKTLKRQAVDGIFSDQMSLQESILSDEVTMSLRGCLKGVAVGAALLPSLRVTYRIGEVSSTGNVGIKATYSVKMPNHCLEFKSKIKDPEVLGKLPLTSVDLPPITVKGEYMANTASREEHEDAGSWHRNLEAIRTSTFIRAVVDIGHFEQSLTTDLLNQLIFLQKGFIKEVNQVISDVDDNEPVPIFRSFSKDSFTDGESSVPLLYSIQINLKGIQLTATTPSSTAVRLYTGIVALELSNRSPNKEKKLKIPKRGSYMKLFGRAEVDLMVSLGQYNHEKFVENDKDFETFAYFKTRIGLTNTLQDKPIFHHSQDKETVIITINKPQIWLMPMAVDKGLLVYLYYKNAYDYWIEQTVEVQKAAQHIFEKLPQRPQREKLYGSLFLQLNVEKLGFSIPLNDHANQTIGNRSSYGNTPDTELTGSALVVTVEETSIMCCSSGSFVSQGLFRDFCLRFASDFDNKAEEWTFPREHGENTCSIPEGTYSLCSRTETEIQSEMPQADKWLMCIFWKMRGIDMHFYSNIGKWLSSLSNALTAFAGDVDVADLSSVADAEDDVSDAFEPADEDEYDITDGRLQRFEQLKEKSSNESQYDVLEKQLWRQTKKVNELRQSSAPEEQISREVRILQDVEAAISQEFFKDVRKRFRRQSRKPSGTYMQRLQSPAFLRDTELSATLSPKRTFHRRHSSVERYLETRELDLLPKRSRQLQGEDSSRRIFDGDAVDGGFLKVADFRSHPDLSDHEMDALYDLDPGEDDERRVHKVRSVKKTLVKKKEKKNLLSPGPAKVTFSDSTYDVRSTSSQRQGFSNMLDFQLDVVVDIDSGKCVLHNDNNKDDDEEVHMRENLSRGDLRKTSEPMHPQFGNQYKKDRFSLGDLGQRGFPKRSRTSLFNQSQNAHAPEDTVLLIPAVSVRLHYQSKTTAERFPRTGSFSTSEASDIADNVSSSSSSWRSGSKSAGLHAWLNIQQLPREMILLPSLLDFVDNALAPISLQYQNNDELDRNDSDSLSSEEAGNGNGSMLSSSTSDHSSFPVDVVVFINVQPSDIRFSCLPISKVECLLRIPSLDFVISSTSTPYNLNNTKSPQASATKKARSQMGNQKSKNVSFSQETTEADVGGFCVTACLSRFSFCIFHPYGKQYGSTSERSFVESGMFPGRRKKRGPVPQPISGRKDSLSLNVEFIKFNLFRKRIKESQFVAAKGRRFSSSDSTDSKTEVQVSITCDIGSAAFNYDMRRLNEILDVPKAWYKRDLYRRMFLGKSGVYARETAHKSQKADSESSPLSSVNSSERSKRINPISTISTATELITPRRQKSFKKGQGHRRTISGGSFLGNIMGSPTGLFLPRASASVGSRSEFLQRSLDISARDPLGNSLQVPSDIHMTPDALNDQATSPSKLEEISEWKSKVLFALNLSRLDVSTNMGNVMGQSIWSTNDLQAKSCMLYNNTGIKQTNIIITVRQGSFDAQGGIVGGYIDVSHISARGNFEENFGENPSHLASVSLKGAETRLDYMGSCILMATLSGFKCNLEDIWQLPKVNEEELQGDEDNFFVYADTAIDQSDKPTSEVKVCGQLGWDELQIVMSRSTTPDFIKMLGKLQEFFNQQQRSGMHAFASAPPLKATTSFPLTRSSYAFAQKRERGAEDKQDGSGGESTQDGLKYQHWVEIMNALPGLQLVNVSSIFPDKNLLIGGSLTLKSDSLLLTCFHGSNFRAQTWALFSINEPIVRYSSEMHCIEKSCQVERAFSVQRISIQLGNDGHDGPATEKTGEGVYMATIRKVSRGRRNPPSLGASVADWLEYVTSTSEQTSSSESSSFVGRLTTKPSAAKRVSFAPKVKYENDSEIIFGMPCFQLSLTNEHDQPMTSRIAKVLCNNSPASLSPWLSTVPSPHVVDSSLTSYFCDTLSVTMDVSLLFFLHDLILTYFKEKDAVAVVSSQSGRPYRGGKTVEPKQENVKIDAKDGKDGMTQVETQAKKEKYRQFRSKAWKLEPGIRLLGWAGTRVDPVNIDWVLEKLGFSHASLTIPKWIQRGAMDPMDLALSFLVKQLLAEMHVKNDDLNH